MLFVPNSLERKKNIGNRRHAMAHQEKTDSLKKYGDGQISDADKFLGQPTSLVSDTHNAGLLLHPYIPHSAPGSVT